MIDSRNLMLMIVLSMVFVSVGCGPGPSWPSPFAGPRTAPPMVRPPRVTTAGLPPLDPRDAEFRAIRDRVLRASAAEAVELLNNESEWSTYRHNQMGTLLIHAVGHGRLRLVEYLLDHGADENASTMFGITPIIACVYDAGYFKPHPDCDSTAYADVLALLVARGVDPSVTMKNLHSIPKIDRHSIEPSDTLLEAGEKLQRTREWHTVERNSVLAQLRECLQLPVDAMLPLNAPSFYREDPVLNFPEQY